MSPAANNPAPRPAPPDDVPASLRKAALCLHAMPPRDREWLLSQLPSRERARLVPLLSELESLGLPPDRALLEEAVGPQPTPAAEQVLRAADPNALAAVLRDEPAHLVGILLRIEEWPWSEALLRRLGQSSRRRVEFALEHAPLPGPALRTSIVEVVARRLSATVTSKRVPARSRLLSFLRKGARR